MFRALVLCGAIISMTGVTLAREGDSLRANNFDARAQFQYRQKHQKPRTSPFSNSNLVNPVQADPGWYRNPDAFLKPSFKRTPVQWKLSPSVNSQYYQRSPSSLGDRPPALDGKYYYSPHH